MIESFEKSYPSLLLGFDVGASAWRWIPVGAAPVDGVLAACGGQRADDDMNALFTEIT